MVKEIKNLKDGVVGFHASGIVTKEDYTQVLIPQIENALKSQDTLNVLYVIDEDFDHYSWQAMFEDTKIGIMHPFSWKKIAIVTDVEWIIDAVKYLGSLVPFKIKTYSSIQFNEAKQWLEEEKLHLNITLDEEKKLLILEPTAVLMKHDFIHLASIIDPYFLEGNTLKGLMIKTKNFPGWDSISALKEHISFIKKHHKKIEKLAFVTDSSFIDAIKTIAGAFVHPKIREFHYAQADEAFTWLAS